MDSLEKFKDFLFDAKKINLINNLVKLIKELNAKCNNIKIVAFNSFDLYYDK